MIKKIKQWFANRKQLRQIERELQAPDTFTRIEVENMIEHVRKIAYNDGMRDGLSIARQQATKSLKEILQWQNQNQK